MATTYLLGRRSRLTGGLTGLVLAASVAMGVGAAAPAHASSQPSTAAAQRAFVTDINSSRHHAHRSTLKTDATLTAVARRWAARLASSGVLKHNPHVTSQVKGWHYLGENVGEGGTVASLHSAFMHSAPHRANVLSTRYTRVGVGVAYGHGRMWVVEVFERPQPSSTTGAVRTYRYGDRSEIVRRAQRKLNVTPTAYFGPITRAHVRSYQQRHHLAVTGTLNPTTRRHLHV